MPWQLVNRHSGDPVCFQLQCQPLEQMNLNFFSPEQKLICLLVLEDPVEGRELERPFPPLHGREACWGCYLELLCSGSSLTAGMEGFLLTNFLQSFAVFFFFLFPLQTSYFTLPASGESCCTLSIPQKQLYAQGAGMPAPPAACHWDVLFTPSLMPS